MPPDSVSFDRAADFYDETRGFPPGQDAPVAALIAEAAALHEQELDPDEPLTAEARFCVEVFRPPEPEAGGTASGQSD